jgi:hypothetical protein
VAPPLAHPLRRPAGLLEEARVELAVQIGHERSIELQQSDHHDGDNQPNVAQEELGAEARPPHD